MDKILRINMGADGGPEVNVDALGDYAGLGGRTMTSTIVDKPTAFEHNTPITSEENYYRHIFESHYPGRGRIIDEMWRPKWTTETDPSARKLNVFSS